MQTSYGYNTPRGVAGMLRDLAPYAIESRINCETDAGVLMFGMGAVRGDKPGYNVAVPVTASTADEFEGIVMTGFTNEMSMEGDVRILSAQTVGILRYGNAWVRIADGVEPEYGDAMYLVTSGADAGKFTNIDTDGIAVKGRFVGGADTYGIAPAEMFNQSQV